MLHQTTQYKLTFVFFFSFYAEEKSHSPIQAKIPSFAPFLSYDVAHILLQFEVGRGHKQGDPSTIHVLS